jgi:hypothetical protein
MLVHSDGFVPCPGKFSTGIRPGGPGKITDINELHENLLLKDGFGPAWRGKAGIYSCAALRLRFDRAASTVSAAFLPAMKAWSEL